MLTAALLQVLASCAGVVGSLFFAFGVMKQSPQTIAELAGTYWNANVRLLRALATQKADYLIGGILILAAFGLQLFSFLVPSQTITLPIRTELVPWLAAALAAVLFLVLQRVSRQLAARYAQLAITHIEEQNRRANEVRQLREVAKATNQGGDT